MGSWWGFPVYLILALWFQVEQITPESPQPWRYSTKISFWVLPLRAHPMAFYCKVTDIPLWAWLLLCPQSRLNLEIALPEAAVCGHMTAILPKQKLWSLCMPSN